MKNMRNLQVDEKQLTKVEAIIRSMTREEKQHPEIINAGRRRRIAVGSGTTVQDVNRLIKQFMDMKKMMKNLTSMSKGKKKKGFGKLKFPFMP